LSEAIWVAIITTVGGGIFGVIASMRFVTYRLDKIEGIVKDLPDVAASLKLIVHRLDRIEESVKGIPSLLERLIKLEVEVSHNTNKVSEAAK